MNAEELFMTKMQPRMGEHEQPNGLVDPNGIELQEGMRVRVKNGRRRQYGQIVSLHENYAKVKMTYGVLKVPPHKILCAESLEANRRGNINISDDSPEARQKLNDDYVVVTEEDGKLYGPYEQSKAQSVAESLNGEVHPTTVLNERQRDLLQREMYNATSQGKKNVRQGRIDMAPDRSFSIRFNGQLHEEDSTKSAIERIQSFGAPLARAEEIVYNCINRNQKLRETLPFVV